MAHSLSAKKRIRQNQKRRARNRWRNRTLHDAKREYDELILHGSVEDAKKKLDELYKILDRNTTHGPLHKNAASRAKSRLAARLNAKAATAAA